MLKHLSRFATFSKVQKTYAIDAANLYQPLRLDLCHPALTRLAESLVIVEHIAATAS